MNSKICILDSTFLSSITSFLHILRAGYHVIVSRMWPYRPSVLARWQKISTIIEDCVILVSFVFHFASPWQGNDIQVDVHFPIGDCQWWPTWGRWRAMKSASICQQGWNRRSEHRMSACLHQGAILIPAHLIAAGNVSRKWAKWPPGTSDQR